jgi:hypothetical protein
MPITAHNGTLTIELARAAYDYDRGRLTVVWRLINASVAKPTEVTSEMKVQDMLAALPAQMADTYGWIVQQAVTAGDIPAGTVQP